MKRCCETCKFFAKGALAGSGWCRHPERVDVHNDLVLVRASQLTCRRGWDQDSWEPITREARSKDRFPRDVQLGPVPPVSQADFNAIINADRATPQSQTGPRAMDEEDRVVDAVPGPFPKVPSSLIAKQLSTTSEPPDADADEVMDEKWMRAAKEGVKKARISNRVRPTVAPLPSPDGDRVVASPSGASEQHVEPAQESTVDGSSATTENSVSVTSLEPMVPPSVAPGPPSIAPIDIETGEQVDWREPLVPSIPPRFDHWDHEEESPTPLLWLVHGVNSRRPDPPQRSLFPQYLLDERDEDDVVVSSNMILDERPFELPPIVESFRPPTMQPIDDPERSRAKPRRKRGAGTTFGSRWSNARERPTPTHQDQLDERPELVPNVDHYPSISSDFEINAGVLGHDAAHPESLTSQAHIEPLDDLAPADVYSEFGLSMSSDASGAEPLVAGHEDWEGASPDPASWRMQDEVIRFEAGGGTYANGADVRPIDAVEDVVVHNIGDGPIAFDPEIDEYVIAPGLSRVCQTCSAFRPTDNGAHGWCSSAWAFDNPQVVSAQELPCASSFGSWWLPIDTGWWGDDLERRDAPTPLYDRLMAMKPQARKERTFTRKRWS